MSPLVALGGGLFAAGLVALWRGAKTRRRRCALATLALAGAGLALVASLASHRERSRAFEAADRQRRAACFETARALEELERLPGRFDDDLTSCRGRTSACALAEFGSGLKQILDVTINLCVELGPESRCDAVVGDLWMDPPRFQRALTQLLRMHTSGRCE